MYDFRTGSSKKLPEAFKVYVFQKAVAFLCLPPWANRLFGNLNIVLERKLNRYISLYNDCMVLYCIHLINLYDYS